MDKKKYFLDYLLLGVSVDFLKKFKKVLDFVCKLLMFKFLKIRRFILC